MYKYFSFVVFIFLFLFRPYVFADESTLIGTYGDWQSIYWKTEEVCSMVSAPIKEEGKYSKRGQVYAQIAINKGKKEPGVVYFEAGYTFKENSKIDLKIDSKHSFNLWPVQKGAWAKDEKDDDLLIKAMKLGNKMVVKGVSSRGTNTIDTYSLKGFIAAYKAMKKICK